jgi:hypothetical protein
MISDSGDDLDWPVGHSETIKLTNCGIATVIKRVRTSDYLTMSAKNIIIALFVVTTAAGVSSQGKYCFA